MSYFSNQLKLALERAEISRVGLAEKSGIVYPTLTNYALGRRPPDKDAMRSILSALPPHEAALLLVERLRDEVPEEHASLIVIEPREPVLMEESPAAYQRALPTKLESAMAKLRAAVAKSPEWADILEDIAKVLP